VPVDERVDLRLGISAAAFSIMNRWIAATSSFDRAMRIGTAAPSS
jgi:hypothetical protein